MVWFKVDDQLHTHPRWLQLSARGKALWTSAGSWCSFNLTDGHVPSYALSMLQAKPADARELVRSGLWHEHPEDGWMFHDWAEYQPSRDKVIEKREKAKKRMAELRANLDGGS